MGTLRVALLALCASICSSVSAEAPYRLTVCHKNKDGISVGFLDARGEKRRMYISPRGVELAGDVKGSVRLSQVTELVLNPILEITYTTGSKVQFGAIDAQCQQFFREVAAPLVHIK